MRPRGEIRQTLFEALSEAHGTCRHLAERTQVGLTLARQTLDNMRRSHEIVVITSTRIEGVRRPVPVYGLPADQVSDEESFDASANLARAIAGCWAEFV